MENSIDYIIKHEEWIIDDLASQIKNGTTLCVECTQRAILYHKDIIVYLTRLKFLDIKDKAFMIKGDIKR